MLRIILLGISLALGFIGYSQTDSITMSLDETIALALQNNLDLKSSTLSAQTSEVVFKQTRSTALPNLNGSYNLGITNGRSIDPYSNDYIDQQLTFSNASLNLDAVVFNGFRLMNSIRRDRLNMKAAEMEINEAKQNLILNVTLAYMQILNNQDLVQLAKLRLETTGKQVDRLKTLYNEGAENPADYTDIQGQYANDETSVIAAENSLTASVLKLAQLLDVDYEIIPQDLKTLDAFEEYPLSAQAVYEDALDNLATFKAKELRVAAAQKGVNVARAGYVPQLSLFAQLNTNYSSAARLYTENGNSIVETGGYITIDGEQVPVNIQQLSYAENEINYNDQFKNNLNSVVGVAVDVPLFNGFRAKNNVALQKIKFQESQVDFENTKSQLQQAIKQAHADMEAAYKTYRVLQDQVTAFEESFRINEIRFNNGVSNIVAYIISKNNLDNTRINLANAKYEYMLRVQVLEYYRGN